MPAAIPVHWQFLGRPARFSTWPVLDPDMQSSCTNLICVVSNGTHGGGRGRSAIFCFFYSLFVLCSTSQRSPVRSSYNIRSRRVGLCSRLQLNMMAWADYRSGRLCDRSWPAFGLLFLNGAVRRAALCITLKAVAAPQFEHCGFFLSVLACRNWPRRLLGPTSLPLSDVTACTRWCQNLARSYADRA